MLSEDARIALVAPSGIFDPARLAGGQALAESWGYTFVHAPHLHSRHRVTAGTVAERRADLVWALTAPDIDAVWLARGGWGTMDLLDGLPWSELDGRPIIGFSDATALFTAMDRLGVTGAVHGPVLHSLADGTDAGSQAALRHLLQTGTTVRLPGHHLCGPAWAVSGRVIGGNLCVLASLAGTPWALRAAGGIVVLEDVGEPAYRLDRLLAQLCHSGALEGAVGVVLGTFSQCALPPGADWTLEDLLLDRLAPLNIPVIAGVPVGHSPANRAWCHGAEGVLSADGLYVG